MNSFPHTAKHGVFSLHAAVLLFLFLLLTTPYTAAETNYNNQDSYGYGNATPSMVLIFVVLISALFFVVFFYIYIRHCNDSSGSLGGLAATNRGLSRLGGAARGLDAAVIETFPTMVYSVVKGLNIRKGALECAVCLNEFEDHETLRLIPKCDHAFHPECIDAWLASHTTCPVCRANLAPQTGDPLPGQLSESDLEAQTDAVETEPENGGIGAEVAAPEPTVVTLDPTLNKNLTRRSGSGRPSIHKFPRSHSTGHSVVQPGKNTDRFTLTLPDEVRKQIMNRELNRALSMVALPREGSSKRGYRTGEGSSRGKYFGFKLVEQSDQKTKADGWFFSMAPPLLGRASSFLTRASSSVRSPKVAASDGEGTSNQLVGPTVVESARPPV